MASWSIVGLYRMKVTPTGCAVSGGEPVLAPCGFWLREFNGLPRLAQPLIGV